MKYQLIVVIGEADGDNGYEHDYIERVELVRSPKEFDKMLRSTLRNYMGYRVFVATLTKEVVTPTQYSMVEVK